MAKYKSMKAYYARKASYKKRYGKTTRSVGGRRKLIVKPGSLTAKYRAAKKKFGKKVAAKKVAVSAKPFIKPQAPAVIAKEVTGISGKLKHIPVLIIGAIIGAYMLLKRK